MLLPSFFCFKLGVILSATQLLALPAIAAVSTYSLQQQHIPPFTTHNWSPTSLIFDIPSFHTRLLSEDKPIEMVLQLTTANSFVTAEDGNERLLIDGEITAVVISAQWRFSKNWQLTLLAPYIDHSGGVWDDLIEDWHDWFGLPQAQRDESANNQFGYFYSRASDSILYFDTETGSPGDVRLTFSRILPSQMHDFVYHIELKGPTGKPSRLTGSGAWDLSMGLGWQQDFNSGYGVLSPFATAGITYLGKTEISLAPLQKSTLWTARAGLHWHALNCLSLSTQLDTHSKIYDSNLKTLGGTSLQMTIGGHLLITNNFRLDLSIGEDLRTRVTPDLVVNLAMAYRY